MKRKYLSLLLMCAFASGESFGIAAQENTDSDKATKLAIERPDLYGTLRMRSEWSTADGDLRFMVRTARVGLLGKVANFIEYKAELDLCDRGEVKVTDVWARMTLPAGFKIQIGQMRMPFTFGSARAPHTYLFSDRPFVDKQFIGPRNAGVKAIYNYNPAGLTIEGGVFNSTALTKHTTWQSSLSAAVKAQLKIDNVTILTGYETLAPTFARTNNVDFGVNWSSGRIALEGEYVYKHYNSNRFDDAHAYNFTADYSQPLKRGLFKTLSFQGRFDGMTAYSSATALAENGDLATTEPKHERLTVGATLHFVRPQFLALFRLNYQNYFYHNGYDAPADYNNMLSAEVVIRF